MNLELRAVSKSYPRARVLSNVSLSFKDGELALILGANGAGKSTLLRICSGLLRPDQGALFLDEHRVVSVPAERLGYVGHDLLLYDALTVRENLQFVARILGLGAKWSECLSEWMLEEYIDVPLGELSKGVGTRVALARATMHSPQLLVLDEPSAVLDERALAVLLDKITKLREAGTLVLMATHDVRRVAQHASRVVTLCNGAVGRDSSNVDHESSHLD